MSWKKNTTFESIQGCLPVRAGDMLVIEISEDVHDAKVVGWSGIKSLHLVTLQGRGIMLWPHKDGEWRDAKTGEHVKVRTQGEPVL